MPSAPPFPTLGLHFKTDGSATNRWGLVLEGRGVAGSVQNQNTSAPEDAPACVVCIFDAPLRLVAPAANEGLREIVILPEYPHVLQPGLTWWVNADVGQAYARVEQRGELLVEASILAGGARLELYASSAVSEGDSRQFMASAVLPLLARMRGHFVLHASTLELDGRLVAFTAASGGGKSTTLLLALAALQDARIFSDDALSIRERERDFLYDAGPCRLKADASTEALA